jgi:hypothetical protein
MKVAPNNAFHSDALALRASCAGYSGHREDVV